MKCPRKISEARAASVRRALRTLAVVASAGLAGCKPAPDNRPVKSPVPPAEVARNAEPAPAGSPASGETSALPALEKNRFDAVVGEIARRDDPEVDGWESEEFSEAADGQLKKLGALLSSADGAGEGLVSGNFASRPLRPGKLEEVFVDPVVTVRRGVIAPESPPVGFGEALAGLRQALSGHGDGHFKFKTVRVEPQADGEKTVTTTHFQISGGSEKDTVQINALWNCLWDSRADPPLLESVDVSGYEEVTQLRSEGRSLFSECTESIFRRGDLLERQLLQGIDYWTLRLDGAISRPASGHGIAIADVNADGLEDVYVCQSPALPNLLLIQQPDGTVMDGAVEAGVAWLEGTRSALFNDLDNDGDPDLVAVLGSKVVVQANDGTGRFELKTVIDAASSLYTVNAVDYDNDNDLDLFFCGYTLSSAINQDDVFANPVPFQDANNGAPNSLLRNDGGWNFTDVTAEVGLSENNMRFSYASSWDDYDGDGDLDLYVANDFGRNNLYRNEGGTFRDVAVALGVDDIGPGMSASWGDYNNDGHPDDLYVSNMFSSAGSRVTSDPRFKAGLPEEEKADFRHHARGNSLFTNRGDGTFSDDSVDLGVTLGRWAWGSDFADFNNDGWQDLYVTNGFMTAENPERDL